MNRMATAIPARKVVASAVGTAVVAVIIGVAEGYLGVSVGPELRSAILVLVSFALGYYVPPAHRDQILTTEATRAKGNEVQS